MWTHSSVTSLDTYPRITLLRKPLGQSDCWPGTMIQSFQMSLFSSLPARYRGGGGGQKFHGVSSESLTESGNAYLPFGLLLVLALWLPRNKSPLELAQESIYIVLKAVSTKPEHPIRQTFKAFSVKSAVRQYHPFLFSIVLDS